MDARRDELFRFGVVTGVHGLKGDLKIRPETGDSTALASAGAVFLRYPDGRTEEHAPVKASPHKGIVLLRLKGLGSIEAVQGLVGCEVLMRLDDLADLDESEHYWFELRGMTVVDEKLGEVGVLEDLFTTAAHDIYVVRGGFGEVLIPAVDEFVKDIDRKANRIAVDLPEGLVREPE